MQVRKMRMTALKYLALENQAAVLPSTHSMNIRESDRKQRMARPAWLGLTPKPDRYPTLVETYSNIVSLKQNPKVHV
ncbi:hypothetical protein L596_007894 [Steinernema carpocapsae]|uniref:Uncharacterized protein n=1 Tax=Steinernema carpocapsae TaxID=34508 RepID=A0A4U5PAZ1_STECR|nr:hypothetical protein L596_007894 [Steinernema carpocapsae]